MNASDADRPESNENVPEPPVPSQPGDASEKESGTTASADGQDASAESSPVGARVPDPIRPAEGQSVDEPSVTFEWERVDQADNYQLQIAKDRDFTELVFDARVGSSSAFTYSGLPPQEGVTLYWRVRAHLKEKETWTEFGTVGTFVLVDWRPEQPALAEAQESNAPVADENIGDSSSTEPILITFATLITVVAVGLAIVYTQDGGFFTEAEEPTMEVADADTVSLDLEAPVPNEDGETYRISINDAMRQVVRERGGTWEESPAETNGSATENTSPENDSPENTSPETASPDTEASGSEASQSEPSGETP